MLFDLSRTSDLDGSRVQFPADCSSRSSASSADAVLCSGDAICPPVSETLSRSPPPQNSLITEWLDGAATPLARIVRNTARFTG
jgi:hypothetical protein